MNLELWNMYEDWKANYKWVDLSHEFGENTPHWDGFKDLSRKTIFDFDSTIFKVQEYTVVTQYGTHVDAPCHFAKGKRTLDEIKIDEMVNPLCVIDLSEKVLKNNDYSLCIQDILEWEEKYGKIPKGSFVAFRSDWSKRKKEDFDNLDENGDKHYPGWDQSAVEFLIKEREIYSIGHETSDTDCPLNQKKTGFESEYYILAEDKYQIELLKNLDKCPPKGALIFCTFLKVSQGVGFSARCFALCPK